MNRQSGVVLVGTAGWEHGEFDGVLYPEDGMDAAARLGVYAAAFDVVELRSSFWDAGLGEADAAPWLEAVAGNPRFRFLVKLHRSFTHERVLQPERTRTVRAFLQYLERSNRLGGVLAQFPQPFTATGAHRYHLMKLGEIFAGFPLHVELRHDSWHQKGLVPFLTENGLRPVNADLPRVNHLMPFHTGVAGETAYLRLHGHNETGWLRGAWDVRYDYLYNRREIRELARRITLLTAQCRRVFVVCNTTPHGKSIANALQIIAATREERKVRVPNGALRAFPRLEEIALSEPAGLLFEPGEYRRAM